MLDLSSIRGVDTGEGVCYSKHMDTMPFGERLRAIRQGRLVRSGPEISIRELARRTGINNATISQIENGKTWAGKIPPLDDVRKFARALGVTIEQLVGEDDAPAARSPADEETEMWAGIGREVVEVVKKRAPSFIVPADGWAVAEDEPEEEMVEMVVFDRFAASFLGSSDTQTTERVMVPKRLRDKAQAPCLIAITGNCLALRGILAGDYVIVDAANKRPREGEIVAFRFRGEDSVKVYHQFPDRIELRPTLENFPTVTVWLGQENDLGIVGVFVGLVQRAERG